MGAEMSAGKERPPPGVFQKGEHLCNLEWGLALSWA